jgi:hypothetical protein
LSVVAATMWITVPAGGERRSIMGGKAIIHINGAEYEMAERYPDKNEARFEGLESRLENMVKGAETQLQIFYVVIRGESGKLMVQPSRLVSASVVFVPEPEV